MSLEIQIKDKKIYAPLLRKWLVSKPEEKVRQEYICRLVNSYGFSLAQMKQEIKVYNSQRGKGGAKADIVVWKNEKDKLENFCPIIVIECKAEHITIQEEDYFLGYNYASWAGAEFFVTTNLKETRIFKFKQGTIHKKLVEIIDIPKAEIINNKKEVQKLLNQTKAFARDDFTKLLFKCHNIIRNNDKLSPEAAFDEISKILFIKIRYEKNNSGAQIFSLDVFKKDKEIYDRYKSNDDKDFYQVLFEKIKEDFKDDDLFDPSETLKIRENSFEAIVEELQIYNLSATSDDVKGIAFEKFLGKTFRGELGQFFTPRTVVDFMVEILDPMEGEVICDPCCGSGGFLIKAFEYVRAKIEEDIHNVKLKIKKTFYDEKYEKMSKKNQEKVDEKVNDLFNKLNTELDINNPKSRLRVLSYDCIYGTDANPRMSRTAKMNMIMHGDGHGGVHHNDGLLNVNGIFDNRFDLILTNPPFGSRVEKSLKITEADKYINQTRITKYKQRYGKAYDEAMEQISKNIGKPLLSLYDTGSLSTLTEVLFIERCLNLLKPGGRMGIVLPEGVLNNANLQKVRDYVEGKAKILLITSIPQDVFIASGATVKPSLLFFKKFTEKEAKEFEVITVKATKKVNQKYKSRENKEKAIVSDLEVIYKQIAAKIKAKSTAKEGLEKLKEQENEIKEKLKQAKITLKNNLKQIDITKEKEIKSLIKEEFDYIFPISEVEKAGISTTGAEIENELPKVCNEFTNYRKESHLWSSPIRIVNYEIEKDQIYRVPVLEGVTQEPEVFYGK
ncbi:N-6 DNA methylase [Apibacter mensalis]|uniref:N-6 DNA methylase n=1 Tax=Apibacter mensalis TaxID=1586267 RepID=UPI0026F27EF8|nr:N-6 DNA methylase [Apibacter mensalis]